MSFPPSGPPTGRGQLSQAEIDKILEGMLNRGARVHMTDPRVSATTNWILGTVGLVMVSLGGWAVVSINRLSESLAVVINQLNYSERTDQAQDKRFDNADRRFENIDDRMRQLERYHSQDGERRNGNGR